LGGIWEGRGRMEGRRGERGKYHFVDVRVNFFGWDVAVFFE